MDYDEHKKIIAFDTLFSNNHIQMLKILLPYMNHQLQSHIAVYIKFMELNYTFYLYKNHVSMLCGFFKKEGSPEFSHICDELLPFCSAKEKKQIEQLKSLFGNMKMYQDIMNTMEMMKEFMPDFDINNLFQTTDNLQDSATAGNFDIMNMLMNMLSPEQKEMFDLFGGDFHE